MTSNRNDEHTQYIQQRYNSVNDKNSNHNGQNNSDDATNRRHSIAHVNFRKAIYRSLSLSHENDEYNSVLSYMIYCMKIFFVCLFILLIGGLIKFIWQQYRT
ncbi:unnamed protein product [Adineta steineri]|uniref:Uncharacterized protein n=1 Tax=Adineta steineri TaxID=433720 RepID=A0A814WYI8_9BILA|nr:unnamed protein product [Adineta steineri]